MRGATRRSPMPPRPPCHFNPRSSCEERRGGALPPARRPYFNPRSSCEERRSRLVASRPQRRISIHAPHARSDTLSEAKAIFDAISIHAPHARSDTQVQSHAGVCIDFNPRSSCEERLPRRARSAISDCHFNPRSSCEERRHMTPIFTMTHISIHAPHARSDSSRYQRVS